MLVNETTNHGDLVRESHAGDGTATVELERRSQARRKAESIAWVKKNLDKVIDVRGNWRNAGEAVRSLGGGLGIATHVAIETSSFRGKMRDLLAAGKTIEPAWMEGGTPVTAVDIPDHGGNAALVQEVWHEKAWHSTQS